MTTEKDNPTAHDKKIKEKAFVNDDGKATLMCPKCNAVKIVSADQFRQRQHCLKVRCACSHVFQVNLDFRKHFRKTTDLSGIFEMIAPALGRGRIKIVNLSLEGARFETSGIHKVQIGQKGVVDFILDDRKATRLKREFIVKSVSETMIGCEFLHSKAFEKELGFYLRFGS